MTKRFMNVNEFSATTGIPKPTVRYLMQHNKLRATKVGRAWLIPADEVDRLTALANDHIKVPAEEVNDSAILADERTEAE